VPFTVDACAEPTVEIDGEAIVRGGELLL